MVARAKEGKRYVRLKGGDPFLFGRGGEELETLRAAKIEVEMVPGVTSALAVPASVGIPGHAPEVCIAGDHPHRSRRPDKAASAL